METSCMFGEARIKVLQVRQILPAVNGGYRARGNLLKQRKMELIDMEMQNVESRAARRTFDSIIM